MQVLWFILEVSHVFRCNLSHTSTLCLYHIFSCQWGMGAPTLLISLHTWVHVCDNKHAPWQSWRQFLISLLTIYVPKISCLSAENYIKRKLRRLVASANRAALDNTIMKHIPTIKRSRHGSSDAKLRPAELFLCANPSWGAQTLMVYSRRCRVAELLSPRQKAPR